MTIREELLNELERLDEAQQRRILGWIRWLSSDAALLRGETSASLLSAKGFFTPEALAEMQAAIDEGCEVIDWDGWD